MTVSISLQPEKWVDLYADSLYRFILHRIADKHLAEDLIQETFLSAWKSRDKYNGSTSEKNWIFAICKNKIIDHYRRTLTGITYVVSNEEDYYFDADDHWIKEAQPSDWTINYYQSIDSKEFHKALNHCRSKLKEIQHMVFSLKYIDDLKAEEICSMLKISIANYWVLMHRAKLQLRACLEKNWMSV